MIDYLRGQIARIEPDHVVVDVGGVGYRVFCANPYAFRDAGEKETTVYIHHHVREDAIQLFGFASREEQSAFRLLLEVSGIGPRVALGALSGGRPEALVAAIVNEDIAYLTRLPGIGKKTAQRMLLDLKDKVKDVAWGDAPEERRSGPAAVAVSPVGQPSAWQEVKEALSALGFTEGEIASVLPGAREEAGENAGTDALMKAALKRLYRT